MSLPPMITSKALGLMPEFALEVGGERALAKALRLSELPSSLISRRTGYIPESALGDFIECMGREIGQPGIGLLWSPYLTVADYGSWGQHVLSAPSLAQALSRAQQLMPLHSSVDRVEQWHSETSGWYGYSFGLRQHPAYPDIAYSAIGVFLNLFRHFLGASWKPKLVCFDFERQAVDHLVDELLACPVQWDAARLGVWYDIEVSAQVSPRRDTSARITVEDIVRERAGGPPEDLSGHGKSLILLQLEDGGISLEKIAKKLDLGPRGLQRRLSKEGATFRELTNAVRIQRAQELLKLGADSITQISDRLGYENANNFSRAFKTRVGLTPSEYQFIAGRLATTSG